MPKTQEEIDALKASWLKDPCWDIEETPGFEEHEDELTAFHKEQEAIWEKEALDRKVERRAKFGAWTGIHDIDLAGALFTFEEIENELARLDGQIGDGGSAAAYCQFVIAREQVRATLLLAAEVKRVGDLLEEKIEEDLGSQVRQFSTKLYKVE